MTKRIVTIFLSFIIAFMNCYTAKAEIAPVSQEEMDEVELASGKYTVTIPANLDITNFDKTDTEGTFWFDWWVECKGKLDENHYIKVEVEPTMTLQGSLSNSPVFVQGNDSVTSYSTKFLTPIEFKAATNEYPYQTSNTENGIAYFAYDENHKFAEDAKGIFNMCEAKSDKTRASFRYKYSFNLGDRIDVSGTQTSVISECSDWAGSLKYKVTIVNATATGVTPTFKD